MMPGHLRQNMMFVEERNNRRRLEPFALAHSNSTERGVY